MINIAKNRTLEQWTDDLSSSLPAPGGGGVGALVGSLASCLASMVANLTVNKDAYKNFREDCNAIILKTAAIKEELLCLVDEDARAFNDLMKAFKVGTKDEDYAHAAKPSMQTVYALVPLLDILEILETEGNKNLISDVGAAASCVKASLEICRLNILINLKYLKKAENKAAFESILESLIPGGIKRADIIYKQVADFLE